MKNESISKGSYIKWAAVAVVVIALLTLPYWWGDVGVMNVIILIFSYLALGEMWNFLGGYAGLPSLGQQCFVGIGGFTVAILMQTYNCSLAVSLLASFVFNVVFALIISAPIFKTSGVYFTIATCVLSQTVYAWCGNWSLTNYNAGINMTKAFRLARSDIYFLSVGVGLLSVAVVYFLLRTKVGMGMMAMRDNPAAAEIRGVKLYKNKLIALLVSSGITGLAGAIIYLNLAYVRTDTAFSMNWTIACVFMVLIGGVGTVEGPIIGAIIYIVLRQLLYSLTGLSMIILGAIAVIIIIFLPRGIMGLIHDHTKFDLFSVRRKVRYKPGMITEAANS